MAEKAYADFFTRDSPMWGGMGAEVPQGQEPFPGYFAGGGYGAGAYGLPNAFYGWEAPARYSIPMAERFMGQTAPIADFFKGEMGKDYRSLLFDQSRGQINTAFQDMGRQRTEGMTRAGFTGGGVSPLTMMQLEQEQMARSGALGRAAQMAVMQAQQMKQQAAHGLHNIYASQFQALMTPARFQQAAREATPIGAAGPSMWGPALGGLGSMFGAMG